MANMAQLGRRLYKLMDRMGREEIHFNIALLFMPRFPKQPIPSNFMTKILHVFHMSSTHKDTKNSEGTKIFTTGLGRLAETKGLCFYNFSPIPYFQ
jgi:hypothetical protein